MLQKAEFMRIYYSNKQPESILIKTGDNERDKYEIFLS